MTDSDFASWLRGELDRLDWTAADLARRLNVNSGRMSEWMHGKRVPSPPSCIRLAEVLGVDPDDVLAIAGHRARPPQVADQKARLIALIRRADLSPEMMDGLEAMLRSYPTLSNLPDDQEDHSS